MFLKFGSVWKAFSGSMQPIGRVELWSPHVLQRVRCALTVGTTLVVSELLAGTATVSRNFLTHSHSPGGSPCTLGAVCERVAWRRNYAQAVMEKYSRGRRRIKPTNAII